jgi:quinoprotein dehydrogenase-associated probable ABC transporter substrate-binding protein
MAALAVIAAPLTGAAQARSGTDSGAAAAAATTRTAWKDDRVLRVCADPDNLPFSNRRGEGFDNRIATLIAQELGDSVAYEWWPTRRGFIRNTLRARTCDVTFGVPGGFDPVLPTKPYYRTTYYLAFPTARKPALRSLDDPALRHLRIGVHFIGEDQTHPPPVHALLARGISKNVTGFSTFFGEDAHHPGELFEALARGEIDVAIAWGPVAGYFAKRSTVPLTLVPLPNDTLSQLPFVFDIGAGVRRSDRELRERLNEVLERRRPDIERILHEFNVPTVGRPAGADNASAPAKPS